MTESENPVKLHKGDKIIVDLSSPYIALGELVSMDGEFLELKEADIHDTRESRTSRDIYLMQAKENGIRVNRRSVIIPKSGIVAIALLSDVI